MGLPSGTLWLDRLVGAPSPTEPGYYYQWGAIIGHTIDDGYVFSDDTYSEQGLDTINSKLSENQDAARAFYGPNAKMPSIEQMQELLQYTSIQSVQPSSLRFTSVINGNSIIIYCGGFIENTDILYYGMRVRAWINAYINNEFAYSLHYPTINNGAEVARTTHRSRGINVMAVHS